LRLARLRLARPIHVLVALMRPVPWRPAHHSQPAHRQPVPL